MSNTILHDKCAAFKEKIKELEEKLRVAVELLEKLDLNFDDGTIHGSVVIPLWVSSTLKQIKARTS